jgi:peptide/nickel transport system permease protein
MLRFIARRLVAAVPIIVGITFFVFLIINLAPGDPVAMMINPNRPLSPAAMMARREALGLNKPLLVRYVLWLGEVARGNLGYSLVNQQPVLERIAQRVPPTVQLMGTALLIGTVVGVTLGVLSAVYQYSLLDHVATFLAFLGVSSPSFFLGLGGIYLLSLKLNLFPTAGMDTLGAPFSVLDRLHHLILPALVLSVGTTASLMRYTRSSMLEVIAQDYVMTARGKGVSERTIVIRHVLRNALLPVITVLGLSIPLVFAGAVITEQIFQWPGIGMLTIQAVTARDYPVLMGISFFTAILVFLGNLLADITYSLADPRIVYK